MIIASGRQVSGESKLGKKNPPSIPLFGIKAHFENTYEIGKKVELHSFQGGYLGLANINQGLTNLCMVIQQNKLKEVHGNLDEMISSIISSSLFLAQRLKESQRKGPWYSMGPLESGLKKFYDNRCFYIGDSCGAIEPLSGDGITMALTSAWVLSDVLTKVSEKRIQLDESGIEYERKITQFFSSPIRLGKLFGYLATHPSQASKSVQVLSLLPFLFTKFIQNSRINSIS